MRTLRLLVKLARMEARQRNGRPRPDLLMRGFFSDRAGLYPISPGNRAGFLTDWEIETRISRLNSAGAAAPLNDKLLFHLFLDRVECAVPRPELAGAWIDGSFVPIGCFPSLESLAESGAELVAKPIRGAGGAGVKLLTADCRPIPGAVILERRMEQHSYAGAIFPHAVNTIRLFTARDPDGGAPFVLGAVHRFGTAKSAPTDNRSRGGIVSRIELDTGRLSPAVGKDARNRRHVYPSHPETGGQIEGVAVPGWGSVTRAGLTLASHFPSLRFIGWDLAIGSTGPMLIEGNAALPNPMMLQMHGPLLSDARARRFFHAAGVISDSRARAC
jgi:hypothetical protein